MINKVDEFTTAAVMALIDSIEPGSGHSLMPLVPKMECQEISRNEMLFEIGKENRFEYFLLMDCSDRSSWMFMGTRRQ